MARVVAFANNKGGVGKTATVIAVAQAWAKSGLKILLIDLDSQGNLTVQMSEQEIDTYPRTIRDAIVEKKKLPIYHAKNGIDYVPANLSLSDIDAVTNSYFSRETILSKIINDEVADDYDAILIDCPPALSYATYLGVFAAEHVVIPTMADNLSYAGMGMVAKLLHGIREYKKIVISGVVVTKYRANKLNELYLDKIKNDAGRAFIEPVVHEATKLQQALTLKEDIYEYDASCRAMQEYSQVADKLKEKIMK